MRIGVVGWGLRSSLVASAHNPENGIEVCALADPSEIAREDFKNKIKGNTFSTSQYKLLAEQNLHAVFILSPDFLHFKHAKFFLESEIPVFLEKPMAINIEDCDELLSVAYNTKTKLFIGHNMRYFGVVRKMKELIDSNAIGDVKTAWCRHFISYGGEAYFRDWHADRSKSTGLLLQKGSHDIDVLHYLCNGFSKSVSAMGSLMLYGDITDRAKENEIVKVEFKNSWPPNKLTKLNPIVDVEDVNMMLMQLDNGTLASYQQCHFAPDAWRNYVVIGTHGRIENFGDTPGKSKVVLWNKCCYEFDPDGDEQFHIPETKGGHGGSDELIIQDFFQFIQTGTKIATSPIAARMSVAAGVCATNSLRNGSNRVVIPPIEPHLIKYFDNNQLP